MEVELATGTEYDKTHPNYERWKRARELSRERGNFVRSLISEFIECKNLRVLDIGSGLGTTAEVFANDNLVFSLERNKERLKKQIDSGSMLLISGDAKALPFSQNKFDLIILQDCIEHFDSKEYLASQLYYLLTENGIIYISTPNRFSILNILSDPHWGMPLVSLFKRDQIKNYFLKYFRKNDFKRNDIAELYSLTELINLFQQKFMLILNTRFASAELMNGNKGLVWSNFHLNLVKLLHKLKLDRLLIRTVNDKPGFINKFITPTFYLVLKKK